MNDKELQIHRERTCLVAHIISAYLHVHDSPHIDAEYSTATWDGNTLTLSLMDKESGLPKMIALYQPETDKYIPLDIPEGSPGLSQLDVNNFQNLVPEIEKKILEKYPDIIKNYRKKSQEDSPKHLDSSGDTELDIFF